MSERWATFDCYGTLVDWPTGVRETLQRLWPDVDGRTVLEVYMRLEPRMQEGRGIPYRQVMAETLADVADELGLAVPAGEHDALTESLPTWRVFPEVPHALTEIRTRGWRLAILSNTDPDLLEASIATIGVEIDERVVASDIGSYKPAVRSLGDLLPAHRSRAHAPRARRRVVVPRHRAVREARSAGGVDRSAR